jgi:hypothetical protein
MKADPKSETDESAVPGEKPVDRRTLLTIAAAWAVPGLGHVLLGRVRRGVLFAVLILGSFGLGLAHDGRLALRDPDQPFLTTMQVVANLGVGPVDLLARLATYHEAAYGISWLAPRTQPIPEHKERLRIFREQARSPLSNYGTAYLWTAGLMNLLLLFDVWDIGRGRKG